MALADNVEVRLRSHERVRDMATPIATLLGYGAQRAPRRELQLDLPKGGLGRGGGLGRARPWPRFERSPRARSRSRRASSHLDSAGKLSRRSLTLAVFWVLINSGRDLVSAALGKSKCGSS